MIAYRRWYRITFCLASIYNVLWGLYAAWDPQWLFRFASLPLQNHPQIFACLGMVVGLYGILYLEVARIPERGWLLAAVGLIGKILGPLGLAGLILSGQWPIATIILCLTNDLIWWLPFTLYLKHAWPFFYQDIQHDIARSRDYATPRLCCIIIPPSRGPKSSLPLQVVVLAHR